MAKIYRTYWLMRRRYHLVGYVIASSGAILWAVFRGPIMYGAEQGPAGSFMGMLPDLTLLLAVVGLPIMLSHLLWRRRRWRHI